MLGCTQVALDSLAALPASATSHPLPLVRQLVGRYCRGLVQASESKAAARAAAPAASGQPGGGGGGGDGRTVAAAGPIGEGVTRQSGQAGAQRRHLERVSRRAGVQLVVVLEAMLVLQCRASPRVLDALMGGAREHAGLLPAPWKERLNAAMGAVTAAAVLPVDP